MARVIDPRAHGVGREFLARIGTKQSCEGFDLLEEGTTTSDTFRPVLSPPDGPEPSCVHTLSWSIRFDPVNQI
jgi:hypothetical protein